MGNVIELAPRVEQRELEQQKTMDAVRFGREVLRLYDLGINDAVTPLWYYLRDGEAATVRIRTDFETDIAERLPRTPFVNTVSFNFTGGDFVSVKDGVSMVDMTRTTLQTINQRLSTDSLLKRELIRAKAEASEVTKLTEWFENAPIGAHLVFESLPIGSQQYAISRIYQKVGNTQLDGSFVSLHNADIEQFNELRKSLTGQAAGQTEEDILTNNFEVAGEHFKNAGEFVDHYVAAYDRLLLVKTGSDHAFGLPDNGSALQNGIEKVRKHPKLTDIYITSVRIIASSEGVVTPTLQNLTDKLGINNGTIKEGDVVTTQLARHILDKVASRIASTIDRADISSLEELNKTDVSPDAGYDMASHYGDQAEQAGETYENKGCPTYNLDNSSAESESGILSNVFGLGGRIDNFGTPKIGVCRIGSCPSRGESKWWPNRTLVGGCDICVGCHKHFEKGVHPEKIYAEQKRKADISKLEAQRRKQFEEQFEAEYKNRLKRSA